MKGVASGKAILFGEHAVVHGVPAIAVGLERGVRAEAKPLPSGPSTLTILGWDESVTDRDGDDRPLARAFRDLVRMRQPDTAMAVSAVADLPPGGGLGCSAALGVAIARALDPSASAEEAAERAGAWERVFHGNPSGIDAAVAAHGGCVLFERGQPLQRVRLASPLHLCVGHTGQASSTKAMVDAVAQILQRRPEVARKTFEGIFTIVKNARLALEAGDLRAVGQLFDLNQMLLSGLLVSTSEIEQMCAAARDSGALGAKLTGAGGGGSVIALVASPTAAESVLAAWKNEGFDGFVTIAGGSSMPRPAPPAMAATP